MRFTSFTDYSLRVLLHLALFPDRHVSVPDIAETFNMSQNHLKKVVAMLSREGMIETVRGRAGGIRLAKAPESISVGDVVRRSEEGFELADCPNCVLYQCCGLTRVFNEGTQAMITVFDSYKLSDLLQNGDAMRQRINLEDGLQKI